MKERGGFGRKIFGVKERGGFGRIIQRVTLCVVTNIRVEPSVCGRENFVNSRYNIQSANGESVI